MTNDRLSLPSYVSNGMVIQQNQPFVLRGVTAPHAFVSVALTRKPADSSRPVSPLDPDFGTIFESGTDADESGSFNIQLPSLSASFDPLSLCVSSGTHQIDLSDILVGEVWLAAGGDNMALPVRAAAHSRQLLEQANTPYVRFLSAKNPSGNEYPQTPASDLAGGCWLYGDEPDKMADRSAIAFAFARELCQELHQPVAIIDLAVCDVCLQSMLPFQTVADDVRLRSHAESLGLFPDDSGWNTSGDRNRHQPGALYHALFAPLSGLALQGLLWMHGEADFAHPGIYAHGLERFLSLMNQLFRPASGQNLTFICAQLPPFYTGLDRDRHLARFNEMLASLRQSLPAQTGLVTLYDLPLDYKDAPPPFNSPRTPWTKMPVGHRMKQIACGMVYQRKAPTSAPECAEFEVVGNKLLISFSPVLDGLRLIGDDSRLRGFSICGPDRVFVEASARLLYGVRVLVWHDQISDPVAVTYADQDLNHTANLVSRDGFPVVPFRSDRVVSKPAVDLEWLHCEHLRIWAVDSREPGAGPSYHPVYQVVRGQASLQVERTNKSEGDGALHLRYETDTQRQVAFGPVLTYPSLYPPLDLTSFSGLTVDVFNPDLQFKSLSVELSLENRSGRPAESGEDDDVLQEVRLGPVPVEPALRWQTIGFSLDALSVNRNRIQGMTLVLTDRKGKGQVFIDRIRLLLPE